MSDKITKSPQIRFAGFTDAWEQRKLGEFIQDYVEKTIVQNQYPVLTSSQKRGIVYQEEYFADRQVTTQNNIGYFVLPRGYFTFRSRSDNGIFKFNRNDLIDKGIISYFYPVFRISNGNSDFFLNMLNSTIKKQVALEAEGTGQRVLSLKKFKNINVVIPEIQEQTQIGNFFKQLVDTITLHQRKLELLKDTKKSLLQKMFPKDGANVPEIRFEGFTDAWQQCKLGEVAEFSKGNGYTKNDLKETGFPVVLYGRLYTKYETIINNVDTFVEMKDKSVISEGNEVVVPASGESAEDISRASVIGKPGFILGGDLNIIKPKQEVNSIFLALTISNGTQQKEMSKRAQGKSVVHLHNSDLKEINLLYPKLEEQKQIGTFFNNLDNLITFHQLELNSLKNLKKSLLQQMFV
ncbi:restriction endonuclease subunit S [Bacillus cereus group sp. BfR-BA-01310]|uniref:restriction endonuclease subunit S n=1 Tax=Bacillus cereus group sp. BfR-BA-01310 TaxID=2920287 RepID=UPI001F57E9B8|nr:restriction endonuclease subunit S [Bacillus cereus group sp. BfR-BA-01310]